MLSRACYRASPLGRQTKKPPSYPSYDYDVARAHEIKSHRRTIPFEGVRPGFNQLHLTLNVSPTGDVVDADATGDPGMLKLWPQLQGEVRQWKFTPFEENGKAVTAEVEEYIDLVPPERLPKNHVAAPVLRPYSKVTITLERSGCFGSCPSYSFRGSFMAMGDGKHMLPIKAEIRRIIGKEVGETVTGRLDERLK